MATTRLVSDELMQLLDLVDGSDSVELKLTVPPAASRAALETLGVDPLDAQIRQVFFFDTPGLDLNSAGVVVRARRVQGRGDDSVVKLRPVNPPDLPKKWRTSPNMVVEVDVMPGNYVCSASMRGAPSTSVRSHLAAGGGISRLFSKEQRQFYADHAPAGVELDQLSLLGPIFVLKAKVVPPDLDQRLVAEVWLYPDGSRILELSTKSRPDRAVRIATKLAEQLRKQGFDLLDGQRTKTKTALEFFSGQLKSSEPSGR